MSVHAAARRPRGALWRAARLTAPRRARLALAVLLGTAAIAAAIALLATSGYLIGKAALRPPILTLTVAIVGVRFFGVARAALRYAERLVSHDLAFRVLADLRARFYERLVPLVPGGVRGLRRGDLLSRFVADVDSLQHLYLRALGPPIAAALAIAGAVAAAWLALPAAAVALGAALLLAAIGAPALTAAAAHRAGRRQARARAALTSELVDVLGGAAELAVYGREADRAARVAAADAHLAHLARRDALAGGLADGLGTLLTGAAAIAVAAVAVPAVAGGALDGVLLAVLVFLALASFEAVAPLPAAAQHLAACAKAAERLEEVVGEPPPIRDPATPLPLPPAGELALEDVSLRYEPGGRWVLDGVSLRLAPGRRVALVGPSGAGKTTIAHLLVRFLDPDAGRVTLGGVDVRDAAQEDLRAAVRLAGQEAHLFTTSIRENVRFARPGATDAELAAAVAAAGLAGWVAELPDGLDTHVGEDGACVSGGQRQRIAFARALLTDARFIVLDEPTAHLDPPAARAFLEEVAAGAGERGVLVVTHTLTGLEHFDQILVLDGGRIAERGKPALA